MPLGAAPNGRYMPTSGGRITPTPDRLNGHDPWAYLRDVLARLPTHLNSRIGELLPHRWQPPAA